MTPFKYIQADMYYSIKRGRNKMGDNGRPRADKMCD